MRNGVRALIGLATVTGVLGTACSDSATSPPATAPVFAENTATDANLLGLLGTVTNTLLATPVHRSTALDADVSWSFVAGPLGAKSSNSKVGLTVRVPAGALDRTVTITVTALKGTAVAYRFDPHLKFDKSVTLTQSLSGLEYSLLDAMYGAHFEGDSPEYTSDGDALVTEVVGATLNLLTNSVSFGVRHFSGWILASGYDQ